MGEDNDQDQEDHEVEGTTKTVWISKSSFWSCTLVFFCDLCFAVFLAVDYKQRENDEAIWMDWTWDIETGVGDALILAIVRVVLHFAFLFFPRKLVGVRKASLRKLRRVVNSSLDASGQVREEEVDLEYALLGTEEQEKEFEEQQREGARILRRKNIVLCLLFAFNFFTGVYMGIKAITYRFDDNTVHMVLLSMLAIFPSIDFVLIDRAWSNVGRPDGIKTHLHKHPLQYFAKNTYRKRGRCDQCRTAGVRVKCYVCSDCRYVLCNLCLRRKQRNHEGRANSISTDVSRASTNRRRHKRRASSTIFANELTGQSRWSMAWRVLQFSGDKWYLAMIAMVCLLVSGFSNLLLPNYKGAVLDSVIQNDRENFQYNMLIFGVLSAFTAVFSSIRRLCLLLFGRYLSNNARMVLFERIIEQDLAFFDRTLTGSLTARIASDVGQMCSPLRTLLSSMLSSIVALVGGLVMCFITSWKLSVLALTTIAPIIFATGRYAEWSATVTREIQASFGDAHASATEAISNARTVKTFSTEKLEVRSFVDHISYALERSIKDAIAAAGTSAFTSYADLGAGFIILFFGGLAVLDEHTLSVGKLITFQLYWSMINNAFNNLNGMVNSFTVAKGAADRVFGILDSLPDIDTNHGYRFKDKNDLRGHIKFENVEFVYQTRPNTKVLQGININIQPRQICALVGHSGCGKSTVLSLLLGLYRPTGGRILIDGKDLVDINIESFHKYIAVVSQETELFARTVQENISYGLDPEEFTQDDLEHAAKLAYAHEFILELEDGYKTMIGERGVQLSGGQRQRLAISRALLRKPKVLLLDEATSNLDAQSEAVVQKAMDNLIEKGNCTIFLIAHRLNTFRNADVIAMLKEGKIVEMGKHDELIALNGEYKALVEAQLSSTTDLM